MAKTSKWENATWKEKVTALENAQARVNHLEYAIMVHNSEGIEPEILRQRLEEGLLEILILIGEDKRERK